MWMVFLGGGLGSMLRYLISRLFAQYSAASLPWATFFSNILGCVILAVLIALSKEKIANSNFLYLLLVTGFCGGLSTFSTFSYETLQLFKQELYIYAILNILISMGVGMFSIYYLLFKLTTHEII